MYSERLNSRIQARSNANSYAVSKTSQNGVEQIGMVQKIVGKNLDECKRNLFDMFKTGYKIIGQRQVLIGGIPILGWGQKELTEVSYVETHEPEAAPADDFQQKRDDILEKMTGGNGSVTSVIQLAQLDKKLEESQRKIDEKMNLLLQATKSGDKPASIAKIENLMQENEFTFEYINDIATRLRSELTVDQIDDFAFVQKTVIDWIGESIKIAPDVPHKYPHVIILVGPTGVGKTTTIAKMAGTLIKSSKENEELMPVIKMITIDNTRVAAEEQLRHYCDIMGIDLFKAQSSKDVKKIFDEYKDKLDILFIDTPGYSPNDHENIGKMTKILEVHGIHPDIYLAFSAATKARDLNSILRNYESCNYKSVIITKWDETTAVGNVISVLAKKDKVISFITDGQKVPNRIEKATVVRFLTNLSDFEVEREHIDEKFSEDK